MSAPFLDQTILRTILVYEPEAGRFIWKRRDDVPANWNTRYAGREAGYDWAVSPVKSYRNIRIFDWPFLGHRLAILYMTGEWPSEDTDHEDGNGLNNKWSNLRVATKAQNGANRGPNANNKLGFKGVRTTRQGRFSAHFRGQYLGTRATPQDASDLYEAAARAHFGEFARVS